MLNHRSVNKMSKKWYEKVKKILDQGDEILKTYPVKMNGKFGWFIISSRRILFLRETGFIQKNYSLTFDKKREDIKYVNRDGKYNFSIIDNLENVSKIISELHSEIICNYLDKWIDASTPKDEHKSVMIHT